jgi:general stress protein YciG
MAGTSEGAKKGAATKLAKDPNFFSKMSRRAKKPRGGKASVGTFKAGAKRTKEAAAKGGAKSRRGKAISKMPEDTGLLKDHKLEYERTE